MHFTFCCSIKFSIDRTDLGNKANREASCAFREVCLLTGRESEHTLRHRDRDHYWAVCHWGNCSCPYTAKKQNKKNKQKKPTSFSISDLFVASSLKITAQQVSNPLKSGRGETFNFAPSIFYPRLVLLSICPPRWTQQHRCRWSNFHSYWEEWLIS